MKHFFKFILISLCSVNLYSHTLLLDILNNENNTITIAGGFSTGEDAQGALIKVEALNSKRNLFEKRLPDTSEITIKIPDIAYQVILDAGQGHILKKIGPAPKNGFKKDTIKKESTNKSNTQNSIAVNISIILAFFLLFATIFISIRNTNKLLLQMKKSK